VTQALWKNRDYMLLWSGQVVSTLGSSAAAIIYPLLILAVTDSPGAAGIASVYALIYTLAPVYNVVRFSYRMALIPDALQGRVNSGFRLLAFGFNPVAALPAH
jgi:hypothetical protein